MKYLALVLAGAALVVAATDGKGGARDARAATDSPADVMARNILEWIQGIYRQGVRKTRQQENNAYLPPYSTQRPPDKPRPFQPASPGPNGATGYPSYQPSYTPQNGYSPTSTPKPTYVPASQSGTNFGSSPSYNNPSTSYNPRPIATSSPRPFGGGSPGTSTTYLPPSQSPSFPSTYYPPSNPSSNYPSSGSNPTGGSPGYGYPSSNPTPGFPTPGSSPNGQNDYSYPSPSPGFPTPGGGGPSTGGRPGTSPGGSPGSSPGSQPTPGSRPQPTPGTQPQPTPGSKPQPTPGSQPTPTGPSGPTGAANEGSENAVSPDDDDLKHPPHIHNIEVQCSKTMMTIDIEFNRNFDGVIYSKGFFTDPNCRYVSQNSGQKEYSFTVSLDSCGTEFINDFEGDAGQAYLENVLVLQNEPGIQEVWDTVRRVRCLWEGNINKALTVSLSVDMLNQEIVTFSGDTATAKLDIQVGKGPFAPAANGLVKIGETMTLVVSVEGDPGFDLQVRDCVARDESSTNVVQLTDERGCILKPKLFGAFQKTNDTGNTGASIIAYAFFQAFKFPDVMDLFIECNIELCKTDCEACPDGNQQIEPGRRRRSAFYTPANSSAGALSEPVRMARGFRVILPDDLSLASSLSLEKMEETALDEISQARNVCMSYEGFYISFSLMLAILVTTTMSSAIFYTKLQRIARSKNPDVPPKW
ncbi:uncharacterized protein [Venturia canescens]|uniref:uncharacterized protein n=1 Tax=Venturia canescens TaxID=32260 RepID=UPI001C9D3C2D|nr:uncharacterized protein LOC122417229 [Venturia canescens]